MVKMVIFMFFYSTHIRNLTRQGKTTHLWSPVVEPLGWGFVGYSGTLDFIPSERDKAEE